MQSERSRTPLLIGGSFLFVVILAELAAVLLLNNGVFTYTLDDPYIHMALADNIRHGHYGVNANEFSAPSSSILWPFLIALLPSSEYTPLVINVLCAMLTAYFFYKVLDKSFVISDKRTRTILLSSLLILLICGTNTVGLLFTGMEHSLQLLLVAVIVYGLIVEAQENKVEWWFLLAVIAAPLIRYENLAITCPVIFYLFLTKHYKHVFVCVSLLALLMGGFSLFLTRLGLEPVPTSVLAKSSIARGGRLAAVVQNLKYSATNPRGTLLICGAIGVAGVVLFAQKTKTRLLAIATVLAITMHLIAGSYGWYNRYEIYIWAFVLLVACNFLGGFVARLVSENNDYLSKVTLLAAICVGYAALPYFISLANLPLAANNIYEQHYQMHRFAVDFYNKPVAVNDLGLVSYKNTNYVLDLWGLASLEALHQRRANGSPEWMDALAKSNNVQCAMIYTDWITSIPANWIEVGSLHLGKPRITPANSEVVFFALSRDAYQEIVSKLQAFQKTLPKDVVFSFNDRAIVE